MVILAALTSLQMFLAVLLILVCLALMVIILLQRGRGGGLSAAFGGGGGGSAFGAKTGDVFTIFTVILTAVYLLIAVVGNYMFLPPEGVEATRADQVGTAEPRPQPPPPGEGATDTTPAQMPVGDAPGGAGGATEPDQPPGGEPGAAEQPETPEQETP